MAKAIRICSIDGCGGTKNLRLGLCNKHYRLKLLSEKPLCSVEGCTNKARPRGMCEKHYWRWLKYGETEKLVQFHTPEEAFAARTEWQGDCLIWTGYTDTKGYGSIRVNGKMIGAYRYAWERVNGPIPEGMDMDHQCQNPPCVSVRHLRLATRSQNNAHLSGAHKDNKSSGLRNVTRRGDKWRVRVQKNGKSHHYGYYSTPEEAASVAEQARKDLFGEYAGKG